ncbi:hypothetical protein [Natronobeatus ordinarius]|uniref:hypothetical protein n=1 Tax=Natronobeatus ordinarius TaxID=2963433 RepID=UPI0020CF83DD|nr:hypothetical protein [Natronobeatus ordinarius]
MGGEHDQDDEVAASKTVSDSVPSILRLVALGFVVIGFVGAVSSDASPIAADSAFSLLFYAGIGCAVVSIYLGVYGAGRA